MFYGWVILFVAMVATAATSPGQSYLVGKFNASIEASLGIRETTLTAAYGLATFLAAIPLLYVGPLADRFGPRRIMGAASVLLGIACVLIGFAAGPLSLGACYFLLRFSGQGVLGLSASHSTAMWFERKLGFATGIKTLSMPVGIVILAPLTTYLIESAGWQRAYAILGGGVCAIMLPLVIFLHRDRPEDIGLRVDGDPPLPGASRGRHPHAHPDAELLASTSVEQPRAYDLLDDEDDATASVDALGRSIDPGLESVCELATTDEANAQQECAANPTAAAGGRDIPNETQGRATADAATREVNFTRGEALRTTAFWIITATAVLSALVGTAVVFLLSKLTGAIGLGHGAEDKLLSVFAVAFGTSAPLVGLITDRVRPNLLIASSAGALGGSCVCLALASDMTLAWASMILFAFSQSLSFVVGTTMLARYFGRRHHGSIRSSQSFAVVTGTSVGPFITAAAAQQVGYIGALWIFAGMCVPVALAGLALRAPVRPGARAG